MADRLPPQNIEAEQSVLGALMLDKNSIIKIADILYPGDFYRDVHNIIYHAMIDLYGKGEPLDILSVTNRLRASNQLNIIGGASYLTELINSIPTAAHIIYHTKIVRQKKTLRDLIEASYHISNLGYQEMENIDSLLDQAEQKIFGISQRSLTQEFSPVKSTLGEAFERIDRLHKEKGILRGTPTGFEKLDDLLAGLQKSDLVILAARPSLGKTSLALDIARHVGAKEKIPVGIFSLEMSRHDIIDRFLAAEAGINLWKLRKGQLSEEGEYNDFVRLQEAITSLSEAPIFIDDASSPTVLQMRAMARRLQAEHGLGLLIVDYLQLIQPARANDSEVQQITEISRSLKYLARELNIPVLALSQLSRALEMRPDQRPRLADLRSSGSIEQDADVVMFIYREDKAKKENSSKPNIAEIIIEKHRNGPTGKIELFFDQNQVSFKNLDKNYADAQFLPQDDKWLQ